MALYVEGVRVAIGSVKRISETFAKKVAPSRPESVAYIPSSDFA